MPTKLSHMRPLLLAFVWGIAAWNCEIPNRITAKPRNNLPQTMNKPRACAIQVRNSGGMCGFALSVEVRATCFLRDTGQNRGLKRTADEELTTTIGRLEVNFQTRGVHKLTLPSSRFRCSRLRANTQHAKDKAKTITKHGFTITDSGKQNLAVRN